MKRVAETPYNKICAMNDIPHNAGVCALVDGKQIALFRIGDKNELYAISNYDPFSKANVISRGIVGTMGEIPKVVSPIYKQQFNLTNGHCIDNPKVSIPTYPIREQGGAIYVSAIENC